MPACSTPAQNLPWRPITFRIKPMRLADRWIPQDQLQFLFIVKFSCFLLLPQALTARAGYFWNPQQNLFPLQCSAHAVYWAWNAGVLTLPTPPQGVT